MLTFKAKMQQIRFLRSKPRWVSLQCSPRPLAGLKRLASDGTAGWRQGGEEKEGEGDPGCFLDHFTR